MKKRVTRAMIVIWLLLAANFAWSSPAQIWNIDDSEIPTDLTDSALIDWLRSQDGANESASMSSPMMLSEQAFQRSREKRLCNGYIDKESGDCIEVSLEKASFPKSSIHQLQPDQLERDRFASAKSIIIIMCAAAVRAPLLSRRPRNARPAMSPL